MMRVMKMKMIIEVGGAVPCPTLEEAEPIVMQ